MKQQSKRIALFPGSFDPITLGHQDIIERAAPLFDEIIIGVGINSNKNYRYSLEKRMEMIERTFADYNHINAKPYEGLTVNFAQTIGASFLIRGVRTTGDFEYERTISMMNHAMAPEVDSVFLISSAAYSALSSTVVREILKNNGDVKQFVPEAIHNLL